MSEMNTKRMTAIEILVVVIVLASMTAISVPRFSHSANLDKQSLCNSNIELIQSSVELYVSDKGKYPADIEVLLCDKEFFPVGAPQCPLGGKYILKSDHTVTCTHP